MALDDEYNAALFSFGGCFLCVSLIFAIASGVSLALGNMQYFAAASLVAAGVSAFLGFFSSYRAVQELMKDRTNARNDQSV